jgi:hypothetical protein
MPTRAQHSREVSIVTNYRRLQAWAVEHAIKIRDLRLHGKGPIVILESWPRRAWCSVGSALAGATVLALVGFVLVTVAFTTRFVLGVDVT